MMAAHTPNFKLLAGKVKPVSKNSTSAGVSQPVASNQQFCHPRLGTLVSKHLTSAHRRPPAPHTLRAFNHSCDVLDQRDTPLVFDSFCGTGMSTAALAERHEDCTVIGIDKSAHRLGRHVPAPTDNYLLVQADCGDFWRLAVAAGWHTQRHYLLYPNPWPKSGQLKRRVHGSADLAALLALGGEVELRSNWQIYAEEFGVALALAGNYPQIDKVTPQEPLTLFERKYCQSGHKLWRCRAKLVHNSASATRKSEGSQNGSAKGGSRLGQDTT
jgi:tRNA (guanine-N7-)-methyltransferase